MPGAFPSQRPILVLLAEDDPRDAELFQAAIHSADVPLEIRHVSDGQEAIDYLRSVGPYDDRSLYPFPDLLVLDLEMPRLDGLRVLDWLREHPDCPQIPTVMLSGSGLAQDVKEAYCRGVKTYFAKPNDFRRLQDLVRLIVGYWSASERPATPARC
jgi:two-component system response regulator